MYSILLVKFTITLFDFILIVFIEKAVMLQVTQVTKQTKMKQNNPKNIMMNIILS